MQKERKKQEQNRVVIKKSIGTEKTTYRIDKKEVLIPTTLRFKFTRY